MNFAFVFVGPGPWSQPVHGIGRLLPHAILDVSLWLLGTVETWTRFSLHLELINEWLDPSREFWPIFRELCIFVFAWTWVLDHATLETVVFSD